MKYKAGVIGCGFGEQHIQWLKESGRVELSWIAYHTNRKRALDIAKKYGIARVVSEAELPLDDVHFVVIATPVVTHFPLTKKILLRNKGVVCDKPLAMNSEEAMALCDLAKQCQAPNMVFFQMRFNPNLQRIKKTIQQGFIGDIQAIAVEFFHDFILEAPTLTWRHSAATGGSGAFGDMGVHLIDCIQWLMEDRMDVQFVGKTTTHAPKAPDGTNRRPDTEDYGHVCFSLTRSGVKGSFTVCRTAKGYHLIRYTILGTKGTALFELNPSTGQTELQLFGCSEPKEDLSVPMNPYLYWIDHLERKTPVPTFEDGKSAQLVMDQITAYGK